MSEKMRDDFFEWYYQQEQFMDAHQEELWKAWQASRAALVVELPSFENGSIRGYSGDCDEANMVVDAVAESLDAAGVNYK